MDGAGPSAHRFTTQENDAMTDTTTTPAAGGGLCVGECADGTPWELNPAKFNRHTFWCGQSGSGKTYALGVVLERLLLTTALPLLILDPNADFVELNRPTPGATDDERERLAAADIRVLRSGPPRADSVPLRVPFVELSPASQAAVLRLDPLADAEEYNVLLKSSERAQDFDAARMLASLRASGDPGQARLATRMENLRVLDWDVWSRGGDSALAVIEERPAATVLDIGGFQESEEALTVALAVLDALWERRAERRPLLIVLEEAHNLCPPDPATPLARAVVERLVRIAAEGRKFGLWLLLSTQRPSKVHPQVLSQCDNLGLLRVNSPRDLEDLAEAFGFAPEELVRQATGFGLGQALFAGGFAPRATVARLRQRITVEGGADVAVPLRR